MYLVDMILYQVWSVVELTYERFPGRGLCLQICAPPLQQT